MSLTDDPLIGRQLGDYRVVDILGRGGMAHVYRGYDANLQRYAAVKVIDANLLAKENEDEYRQRFQREARSIARLSHPNIVGIYQFGEVGPLYYMAMAFIEGRDLGQILKEHAVNGTMMAPLEILQIIRDIAEALDYAHAGGVIHRDIKPSNIMVAVDNRAILTDFGLALSVPEGSIGNTFGSAHYIAPEQAISSANAVAQSDLYSLGVVLYQMLTGKVPFDDPSAMSVALKHLSDPPPSPRILNPTLSIAVEKVVLKALEKEPSKRYQNGESMAAALEEALISGKTLTQEHLASITSSRPSRMFPMITLTKDPPEEEVASDTLKFNESRLAATRAQLEKARRRLNRSNSRIPLIGGVVVVALVLIGLVGAWVISRNNAAVGSQPDGSGGGGRGHGSSDSPRADTDRHLWYSGGGGRQHDSGSQPSQRNQNDQCDRERRADAHSGDCGAGNQYAAPQRYADRDLQPDGNADGRSQRRVRGDAAGRRCRSQCANLADLRQHPAGADQPFHRDGQHSRVGILAERFVWTDHVLLVAVANAAVRISPAGAVLHHLAEQSAGCEYTRLLH